MDVYPLPGAPQPPSRVDEGWSRVIRHGRRTVRQVLDAARAEMELQDAAEAYRADPVGYIQAHRRRHQLWDRWFGHR
jgi:hypothetical protein